MIGKSYRLVAVVAMASNRVIGQGGSLPWHLPEDLKHFKKRTGTGAVVMGRRTWESLPERFRPLPGRRNIVVSRSLDPGAPDGAEVIPGPAALDTLGLEGEVFLIGGGLLYEALLPECDEICLTFVYKPYEGDTKFPVFEHLFGPPTTGLKTSEFEIRNYRKPS